jgi:hypothetical protein
LRLNSILCFFACRETGLLCFSEEKENKFMKKVIKSFDETPGSSYEIYKGHDFHQKFPYLKLQDSVESCFDPTGGVLMADKALRAVQVRKSEQI